MSSSPRPQDRCRILAQVWARLGYPRTDPPTQHRQVVAATPATSRPLTLMGLDQTIVLYPSLAHAVTAMTDPTGMTGTPTG